MAKWSVEVDGVFHEVVYKRTFSGGKVIVDGEVSKTKSLNNFINVIDHPIRIGTSELRLVVVGNTVDLAVDGYYIKSKKPYVPINNTPAWVWVLVGLSTLGGFFLSGILSLLIGLLMSILYIQFSLSKKNGAVIGAFIGCTILQFALFTFFVMQRIG